MPTPKEKPKGAKYKKGKGKSARGSQPAISAKQAAKLMKDKYVQQLDQRQSETGSTEVQAAEQVEGAGTWAVDDLILHERPRSLRQQSKKIKERPRTAPEGTEQTRPTAPAARSTDRSLTKGPAARIEYVSPSPEDTVNSHQDQAEVSILPRENVAGTARENARPPRREAPLGYNQSAKASPHQKPTAGPRQYAAPSPREKPAPIGRAYQPSHSLPAEHYNAGSSTTAISPKKAVSIKERSAKRIKEKGEQAATSLIKQQSASPSESIVSIESIHPPKPQPALSKECQVTHSAMPPQRIKDNTHLQVNGNPKTLPQRTPITKQPAAAMQSGAPSVRRSTPPTQPVGRQALPNLRKGHVWLKQQKKITPQQTAPGTHIPGTTVRRQLSKAPGAIKDAVPKTKGAFYTKGLSLPKSSRSLRKTTTPKAVRTAHQTLQRQMTRRAVQQVKTAAKAPVAVLKKTAVVATKAAAALINSAIALAGGSVLLLALVMVVIIAAVANSPFGLFFAQEPNAPGTVSVAQAVGSVNMAYNGRLELLQSGDYDDIVVQGQAADWSDVLAVFAVRTAGADVDGLDVATLDADRVDKLTTVFWDMTVITVSEETIDHPAAGSTEAWTETILHLTITPKTADDMRTAYAFSAYQNSALDELLSDRSALSSLAGSLAITSADVRDILAALPGDLAQARQDTVQTALQLVGKVNYFWGGKSRVIGWDSRWGQLKKVTAAGNSTSGTYRPFGLDCSGFVDWTFNNSLGYIIGHGGGARAQHTYCTNISQSEAQPGDLAFYPDDSHVGVIVGRNAAGKLLVCHCSSGSNNVVVTEFSASGFTTVGRPDIFSP